MIRTRPATQETPAEHWYTKPINCVECGAEWDEDGHYGDEFAFHPMTDEPVCYGRCWQIHTESLLEEEEEVHEAAA